MILMSLGVPSFLLIMSMLLGVSRPETSNPPVLLTPSLYGAQTHSFISSAIKEPIEDSFLSAPGIGTTCMDNFQSLVGHNQCQPGTADNMTVWHNQVCSCSYHHWECQKTSQGFSVAKEITNTTDVVFNLPHSVHPNQWILNTYPQLIETQFGGWRFLNGTSVAYFNNKGFHSSAAYLNSLNNARDGNL